MAQAPAKKIAKRKSSPLRGVGAPARELTGQALLDDMKRYGDKVSASPEAARDFLRRVGVIDSIGRRRSLIRG